MENIAIALNAEFPKPRVDAEWLDQCCLWIAQEKNLSVAENFQEFFQNVRNQLLASDLKDSMQHGTGLHGFSTLSGNLPGPPVLVQILAIKEIGVSAFQLEQIRAAREERILAGVGDEEGQEDGDVEVEGEGPMPKYPRATLLLRLSDGATEFDAMEYRPIPQLVLGITKLGYKLQLKGTRFSSGIAFLEPATINLIGAENAEMHAEWEDNLKEYLQARLMGQVAETQGAFQSAPLPNYARAFRAPLRDISPRRPTLHDDDIDMEPRRKRPSNASLGEQSVGTSSNSRSIKPLPTRIRKSCEISASPEARLGLQGVPASKNAPGNSPPNVDTSVISLEDFESPVPPEPEQRVQNPLGRDRRGSFDFDLLDEVDDSENVPPPRASRDKGKGRAVDHDSPLKRMPPDGNSSDYGANEGSMFGDDNFWEALDRVEKEALRDGERPNTQNHGDGYSRRPSAALPSSSFPGTNDVIELDNDSDEESNKENSFVPMRHVRRRTEDMTRGRSPPSSENTTRFSSQRKKSVIDPGEVIDLSDSD